MGALISKRWHLFFVRDLVLTNDINKIPYVGMDIYDPLTNFWGGQIIRCHGFSQWLLTSLNSNYTISEMGKNSCWKCNRSCSRCGLWNATSYHKVVWIIEGLKTSI